MENSENGMHQQFVQPGYTLTGLPLMPPPLQMPNNGLPPHAYSKQFFDIYKGAGVTTGECGDKVQQLLAICTLLATPNDEVCTKYEHLYLISNPK